MLVKFPLGHALLTPARVSGVPEYIFFWRERKSSLGSIPACVPEDVPVGDDVGVHSTLVIL